MILKQIIFCPYCNEPLDVEIDVSKGNSKEALQYADIGSCTAKSGTAKSGDEQYCKEFFVKWSVDIDESGYKIQLETRAIRTL